MNSANSIASKSSRIAYRIILSITLAVASMWLVTSALSVSGAGAAVVLETTHLRRTPHSRDLMILSSSQGRASRPSLACP